MAFPWSPIIGAAGSLASSAFNIGSQAGMNKKNRQWHEKMYGRQFSDNLRLWEMQNEYNHPANQWKRLEEGNINPKWFYAKGGDPGMAGAATGGSPGSPTTQAPRSENPGLAWITGKRLEMEESRVAAQNHLDYAKALGQNISNRFADAVNAVSLEGMRLSNAKLGVDMQVTRNRDEREAYTTAQNLEIGMQKIINMREQHAKTIQERENLKEAKIAIQKSNALKQLEINLRRKGITFGDALPYRQAALLMDYLTDPKGQKSVSEKMNQILQWAKEGKLPSWITDPRWLDGK